MRTYTFILLISFSALTCVGQQQREAQKIARFKNNYLRKAKLNKPDTLQLDSITMVRVKYPEDRLIKTFYKGKDLILYEYYYNGTTRLKSITQYDSLHWPTGIAKHYTQEGLLAYTEDYDNGDWIVYDLENYPFYHLQKAIKLKADSLISKMYGPVFLRNHTARAGGGSYMANEKERVRRNSKIKDRPTTFEFCYKIKLDSKEEYTSYIFFNLDDKGNFLPAYEGRGFAFKGYGFEDVADSQKGGFRLNYSEALQKAKSLGLTETDTSKAFGLLRWEGFRKMDIINGHFRFYIAIKTSSIKESAPGGHFYSTTKYDVYVFNPWTTDFVEIKKMKIDYWENKNSRGWTDLVPGKEN